MQEATYTHSTVKCRKGQAEKESTSIHVTMYTVVFVYFC